MRITANSFMPVEAKIIIDGKSYTGEEFNRLVEALRAPSLTDDQQVVLEWLKESCNADDYTTPMLAIYKLYSSQRMAPNSVLLTKAGQFQVLAAFAEWGLKEANQ